MPGGDENSVRDVQPVFIQLRKIADDTNAAIIVIHHSNKAGGFRGSTAMKGAVDLMLLMKAEDGFLSFRSEKARDIEPIAFGATTNHIDGRFYLSTSELQPKPIAIVKSDKHVLKHLDAYGDADTKEIMTTAEICTPDAARQAVYRLVDEGFIHRTNDGGRGKMAIYGLTERGKQVVVSKL
jgi:predicted transcriptional regulator